MKTAYLLFSILVVGTIAQIVVAQKLIPSERKQTAQACYEWINGEWHSGKCIWPDKQLMLDSKHASDADFVDISVAKVICNRYPYAKVWLKLETVYKQYSCAVLPIIEDIQNVKK